MSGDEEDHDRYLEMAAEVALPDKDLPAGMPGNEAHPEYFPSYDAVYGRAEPEPQRRQEPQPQRQQQQQQQPQQRQQEYAQVPDVEDDPIGHFSARDHQITSYLQQAHNHDQHKLFWEAMNKSEDNMRKDLEEDDYDDAVAELIATRQQELQLQYPDTQQTMALARHYGHASPAHLRSAIIQHDAEVLAQQAWANGQTPAQMYYAAAIQRGYRPKTVATKSHMKNVMRHIDKVGDKDFDEWWAGYERASKQVEANLKDRDY